MPPVELLVHRLRLPRARQAPTYYAKQLVLHVAIQTTTLSILADEIEVGNAKQERHMSCEGVQKEVRVMFTRASKEGQAHDLVHLATAVNPFETHIRQQALQQEGIRCQVPGDYLDAGVGNIPDIEAGVWVEADNLDRAKTILGQHQDQNAEAAPADGES